MNKESFRKLLPQADLCRIYRLPPGGLKTLREVSASLDYACFNIDFLGSEKIESMLDVLGQTLGFPEWYGANLDALSDCLTDFSWHESRGYVLVISGADTSHATSSAFAEINAVFTHAIDEWRAQGIPFWIFYDMRTNDLPALPVQE